MKRPVIGYVGMTHLGINSAIAAAEKGFEVVCYDTDSARIEKLARYDLPIVEPGLNELLNKNKGRITFTSDSQKVKSCDLVYIAPDVPTDDMGRSDLSQIHTLIGQIDKVLGSDSIMIILSQVPPGFTRGQSRAGSKRYYQVETLIFGRAVERALYPERFIIGCADPEEPLHPALAQFLGSFGCPILPMRYESAELAKISINMYLVASVSVANTLAEVCEHVGADWSEIVPALKLDKRIGAYSYLTPGLGISGGNLERDLATVCNLADKHDTDAGVVRAWIANSSHRKEWPWRTLKALVTDSYPAARIAILGLSYKADTHSTKNSPALALLAHLQGRIVSVFDPVVSPEVVGPGVTGAPTALDAVQDADVVCVMTPWSEFKSLAPSDLAARMRGRLIIDPYNVFDSDSVRSVGLDHVTLGVAPELATSTC